MTNTSSVALLLLASVAACSSARHDDPQKTQAAGGFGDAAGTGGSDPGTGATAGLATGGGSGSGGSAGAIGAAGSSGTTAGTFDGGGSAGSAGAVGTSGASGAIGASGMGGADASVDSGGAGGTNGASGAGGTGTPTCCPTCLCRGPAPTGLTSATGPFGTLNYTLASGRVFHPTNAGPPFASVVIITRAGSSAPELGAWGSFYASHGIVTFLVVATLAEQPPANATQLLEALEQLKAENTRSGSPLFGKLSDRFGIAGYSSAAGGATLASSKAPTLKSSVNMAVWGGNGSGVQVPTLLLCGEADPVAPCSMSEEVYAAIPASTPKMMMSIGGANHFSWFSPTGAGSGMSGEVALAFHKVFLEGDERYRPFLLQSRGTVTTTIR